MIPAIMAGCFIGSRLWRRLAIDGAWRDDPKCWLEPYIQASDNRIRQWICPADIARSIGSGDRKGIQPMAAWADGSSCGWMHYVIGAGP